MFAVQVSPLVNTGLFAVGRERLQVAAVVLAGQWRQATLELEVPDKAVDPASFIHGIRFTGSGS
jgi:hypothetical protein